MTHQDKANVVVLGRMNPAIHHPEWYRAVGILDARSADEAMRGQVICTPPIASFGWGGCQLVCEPEKWMIEGSIDQADIVLYVAGKVFERLHDTPVSAFGFNFKHFREFPAGSASRRLTSAVDLMALGLDVERPNKLAVAASYRAGARIINLALDTQEREDHDLFTLGFNFHYEVGPELIGQAPLFDLEPLLQQFFEKDLGLAGELLRSALLEFSK